MKLRSVKVCVKEGLQGISRNGWMVTASVLTVSACLFIFGIVYCIVMNVRSFANNLDDNLGIVAFLSSKVPEESVPTLLDQIRKMDGVKEVQYISAEEAWESFKESMGFGEQLGTDMVNRLDQDNPLADSASFQIYLYDAGDQEAFVSQLKTMPQFRRIQYAAETAAVMSNINRVITIGGLVLILLLIIIAILLISNTIKLSVYVRREEIEIKEGEDILTQIVRHYMLTSECARYMSEEKVAQRKITADRLARENGAEGIVYEQMKFCDFWAFERPLASHILHDEYGWPVLSIDRPYNVRNSGQLRTRFQAFVEALEIKRIHAEEEAK